MKSPVKKAASKSASRKASASPLRKTGTPGASGGLTNEEKGKLCIQAAEALGYQIAIGNLPESANLSDFRRDQVMACIGLAGVSKINRSHWRNVSAHFLTLAGREDEAFELLNRTGDKTYRGGKAGDTWEASEVYVSLICKALADHLQTPVSALVNIKAHITTGWLLTAARQRTGKPRLTMENLAERLDPKTLIGLLSHLNSHINLREGRADLDRRSPRKYPAKPDPGQLDDPF